MKDKHRGHTDPWRALAAGILHRAVLDARYGDVGARAWLIGDPVARGLADALDVERSALIRAVAASTNGGRRDG